MKNRDNKGFSLVELIVVIAIMAVLVGILAPQFLRYVEKAKVASDMQNFRAVKSAMAAYYMDSSEQISDISVTASQTKVTVTGTDASAIMQNAGLSTSFELKSKRWSNIEISYDSSTRTWTITGTNSLDSDKYDLSKEL